jgi:hypothetical protein
MNKLIATRFFLVSLVFSILYSSCKDDKVGELAIIWENNKPVKLAIPKQLAGSYDKNQLQVFLANMSGPAILGEYTITNDTILFQPAIPFTRGLIYKVVVNSKPLGTIAIPPPTKQDRASVFTIYPTSDIVPENLLKIYIEFSKPMKEGESLKHLLLMKNEKEILSDVFLDLQPELWNETRTILTVWFDPGRIKRDLQPNITKGPPLTKGNKYTLIIKKDWPNENGAGLFADYTKDFVTGERDTIMPDPSLWKLKIPKAGTQESLFIDFNEPMDFLVITNALHISDKDGYEIPCTNYLLDDDTGIGIHSVSPWKKGDYYLTVESRVEDLAGNNLDHPFDNDITVKQNNNAGKGYKKLIRIE